MNAASTTDAGLDIRDLTVALHGQAVLHGIDCSAGAGELLVLAGPSGSGKSTLLRAIAGLVTPRTGRIAMAGRELTRLTPGQREIAMVFQDHALLPHLTVVENLAFGLRARGAGRRDATARAEAVAQRLGLETMLRRRITQLSGGERQRVALGRALLRGAKLVLMDEPLSSLDGPLRARMRREIVELHRSQGWTTVYVTHDQAEALSMADRLGVLADGRLLQLDTPRTVYSRPASMAVARFIGSPPMNLVPTTAADGVVDLLGGRLIGLLPPGDGAWMAGIRPEDVHLAGSRWAPAAPSEQCMQGHVVGVEHVGDQQFATVRLSASTDAPTLIVRQEPDRDLRPDMPVELAISAEAVRWFDVDTGDSVASRTA